MSLDEEPTPTEEQLSIIATTHPPLGSVSRYYSEDTTDSKRDSMEQYRFVFICAAAGSGKTYTLGKIADTLVNVHGHEHIQYVVFNKANVREAKRKIEEKHKSHGFTVSCKTTDALAMFYKKT